HHTAHTETTSTATRAIDGEENALQPVYKGSVSFRGATYDGIHEPLVGPEVWYRVQSVLGAEQVSGEKTQTHDHTSKAPSSAVSAAPDSWSPTPRAAVASSTRTSSVPDVTPNAPTVN